MNAEGNAVTYSPCIAWDTSSRILDVALHTGNRLDRICDHAGRRHNELLTVALSTLLARHGVSPAQLSCIACCRGPGSFTGLRIGIATAKGIVAGLTDDTSGKQAAPRIVAVPTLFAYARALGTAAPVLAAIDGRKRRFYAALYRHGAPVWGPFDATAEAICNALREHVWGPELSGQPDPAGPEPVYVVGPDNSLLLDRLREYIRELPPGERTDAESILDTRLVLTERYDQGIADTLMDIAQTDIAGQFTLPPEAGPEYLRVSQAEE